MSISTVGGSESQGGRTKLGFRLTEDGVAGEGLYRGVGGVMVAAGAEAEGEDVLELALPGDTRRVFFEEGLRGMVG